MKKLIIILIAIYLLTISSNINAHTGDNDQHGEPLDAILNQLLTKQNKQSADQLDCEQLTEHQLEELGEAVMSQTHPNAEVHQQMDAMMGGEGSESLKQAHINMALNFLDCAEGDSNIQKGGDYMMGYNGFGSMMGGSGGSNLAILSVVNSLLFTVLLIVLIRYFWNKGNKK